MSGNKEVVIDIARIKTQCNKQLSLHHMPIRKNNKINLRKRMLCRTKKTDYITSKSIESVFKIKSFFFLFTNLHISSAERFLLVSHRCPYVLLLSRTVTPIRLMTLKATVKTKRRELQVSA